MTKNGANILLVEDSVALGETYKEYLRPLRVELKQVTTGVEALAELGEGTPELVLLDLKLPDMEGGEILKVMSRRSQASKVVVITAHGSVANAVEAMREGASDFLVKPFDGNRLRVIVRNALERQELIRSAKTAVTDFDRDRFGPFIGQSVTMQTVYRMIEGAATTKASVFVVGESGTGKELCAETIHRLSARRDEPFVALNCAAIPKELMESEIFGHKKGAFTGASEHREGAALKAQGGTLFLDEISEMDMALQSKLLRFIQTGTIQKVGEDETRKVDIRFMCATNRTPLEEVAAGRFREDLYYRLHVIPIQMPPLRSRREDVVLTARFFLRRFADEEDKNFSDFSEDAVRLMLSYDWPGNVRELENVLQSAIVLHEGDLINAEMLLQSMGGAAAKSKGGEGLGDGLVEAPKIGPLWLVERDAIENAIAVCDGNIQSAAARLEISPSTIYRKIQSWKEREGKESA